MEGQLSAGVDSSRDSANDIAVSATTRSKTVLAVVLVLLGLSGLSAQLTELWILWITDPLRSFGMLLPLAAICIGIKEFKASDWQRSGSWWGFAAMVMVVVLAMLSAARTFHVTLSLGGRLLPLHLLPIGIMLFLYFSGAVLFLGGRRAVRTHCFSLALLLFVNPVPHMFSAIADLPLQAIGAQTARGFAHWLAVPVNGDALKLMFSPQLGMFVAPGCDGLRGAVALGYLALIVGHLKHLKSGAWALFVAGAVLLAYLFNLLRLCGVILYYWVALRLPIINDLGTEADYVIGGILFFCAALFLFGLPRLLPTRS